MVQPSNILEKHNLRKTSIRLEVLKVFLYKQEALSHSQLEQEMNETDRVTLYRTLKKFEETGIIHKAIDGTDVARYALCQGTCQHHNHEDNHAHFHCNKCGKTRCLDEINIPHLQLPQGFEQEAAYLIIKGICKKCKI